MFKIALIFFGILLFLVSCAVPENFQGIAWNVELNIPLMNRSYPLYDLEDGTHFIIDDGEMFLVFTDEFDSDNIAAELKLGSKTTGYVSILPVEGVMEIELNIDETGTSDEDIDLTYGLIESGVIKIEITDTVPELTSLQITFTSFLDPLGEPFEVVISEFSNDISSFDIRGYSIGDESNDSVIDELIFSIEPHFSPIEKPLGTVRIFFDEPIYFAQFRGHLINKKVPIPYQSFDFGIDYPSNLSNAIRLEEATFSITMVNEFGFDSKFIGKIIGINKKDNKSYTFEIFPEDNVFFHRAQHHGQPTTTTVVLDPDKSVELINIFPDKIYLKDSKIIVGNNDGSIGFANSFDDNIGSYHFITPASFSILNQTIVPDTVHTITINEDNREYIEKYPESVGLSLMIENSLPIGAIVDMYFSTSPDTLFLFNPDINPDIHTVTFIDNNVSAAVSQTDSNIDHIEISMTRDQLELFLNDEVHFALKITFEDSNGTVHVRPEQGLKIIGRLTVDLNIDI